LGLKRGGGGGERTDRRGKLKFSRHLVDLAPLFSRKEKTRLPKRLGKGGMRNKRRARCKKTIKAFTTTGKRNFYEDQESKRPSARGGIEEGVDGKGTGWRRKTDWGEKKKASN